MVYNLNINQGEMYQPSILTVAREQFLYFHLVFVPYKNYYIKYLQYISIEGV